MSALRDVVVIEAGCYLPAALTCAHLRDMGAHVTRVVRPSGCKGAAEEAEYMRHMTGGLHERKESVQMDLKNDADRERFLTRIASSDVFVHNFAEGVVERLGIGYEACRARNAHIIYVSMHGYMPGENSHKAHEAVLLASCGVFTDMGLNRMLRNVGCSYTELPMASVYASVFAAYAVAAALCREPRGEHIVIPIAACVLEALVHNTLYFDRPSVYKNLRSRLLSRDGQRRALSYDEILELLDPFYSHYWCSDGRPFYLVCPSHMGHQTRALEVLGLRDEVRAIVCPYDAYDIESGTTEGLGGFIGDEDVPKVRALFKERFRTRTAFEWEALFGERAVPGCAHRSSEEWQASDHAVESGLVEPRPDGCIVPGAMAWTRDWNPSPTTHDPSPHKVPPRNEKGDGNALPSSPARAENGSVAPLEGLTVLDVSNVIAGPTIGTFLARLGARVIKLDAPAPSYAPDVSVIYGLCANAAKESVLINILHPRGREAFDALLASADVLIANFTPDGLSRLHIDPDHLMQKNPRLVLMHFDAYGGPKERGPMRNYVGYDDNVQAATGIMVRFGGGMQSVEEHAHIGTIDVIAGVCGAFSTLCGILRRRATGRGVTCRCSLSSVGQVLQYPFFCGSTDVLRERADASPSCRGIDCKGTHALHRSYRCVDGWAFFALSLSERAPPATLARIRDALELPTDCELTENAIATHVATRSVADFEARLEARGFGCTRLMSGANLRKMYATRSVDARGPTIQFVVLPDHPIGPLVTVGPIAVRHARTDRDGENLHETRVEGDAISRTIPLPTVRPAPKYGSSTSRVLREIGHEHLLMEPGCASTQWSHDYLPYSKRCARCLEHGMHLTRLACDHAFCTSCLGSQAQASRCFICGSAHEFDRKTLSCNTELWRMAYNDWRRGRAKGATDMENIRKPRSSLTRTRSF